MSYRICCVPLGTGPHVALPVFCWVFPVLSPEEKASLAVLLFASIVAYWTFQSLLPIAFLANCHCFWLIVFSLFTNWSCIACQYCSTCFIYQYGRFLVVVMQFFSYLMVSLLCIIFSIFILASAINISHAIIFVRHIYYVMLFTSQSIIFSTPHIVIQYINQA